MQYVAELVENLDSLDNLERQMTRSIARLRQAHTRQNGMAEIRAMAEGLLEADIPVVLKCLRSASNVHEGVFQRECVKVVTFGARAQMLLHHISIHSLTPSVVGLMYKRRLCILPALNL